MNLNTEKKEARMEIESIIIKQKPKIVTITFFFINIQNNK